MKGKGLSLPVLGGASLLTIFSVLCLVTVALLSVSTARSQARFAEQSARSVAAYYEADARAEAILARLRAGEMPPEVREEDDVLFCECRISDTQTLEIQVKYSENGYEVLRWQAVSTVPWAPEDHLNVWDGTASP